MSANSEGSGETAQMRSSPEPSLVAYVISTIISCAGSSQVSFVYLDRMGEISFTRDPCQHFSIFYC